MTKPRLPLDKMSINQAVVFQCPACAETIRGEVPVEVVVERTLDSRQVKVFDLAPIKCPQCGKYAQVEAANLYFDWEITPLETN